MCAFCMHSKGEGLSLEFQGILSLGAAHKLQFPYILPSAASYHGNP